MQLPPPLPVGLRLFTACLCLACLACLAGEEAKPKALLEISADKVGYGMDSSVAEAEGNVQVTYGDIRLHCGKATINQETRDFAAEGDVEISLEGKGTWRAPSLRGNLDARTVAFGPFRLDTEVWHLGGESGESLGAEEGQVVSQAWMTTCDRESPHYRLQAKKITYDPRKGTFRAKHATLRLGNLPVFYFPLVQGSATAAAGMLFRPGYSGKRGAYLRVGRIWKHGMDGNSQLFVDAMSKRGLALGQSTEYRDGERREIQTSLYGLHDLDPAETERGYDRRFRSQEDRYRLKLYWREGLDTHWSLRLNADLLSDISMLDDWFRHDWRHWGQPKSFANLAFDNGWLHSAIQARPRLNPFYTVGEQLPEWSLDIPRLSLPASPLPLVYSSHTTAGYYTMKWRNFNRDRKDLIPPGQYQEALHQDPVDYGAFRADTLHTLQMPLDIQGAFTLTPRASLRLTSYSRTSRRRISQRELADWIQADNPDDPAGTSPVASRYDRLGGSRTRFATEIGVEGRTALHGNWAGLACPWLDMKGLRHVVEPYFNYTYAGAPSVDREHLYFFDEIDRLQRQNFLRVGVEQRWMTRGESGRLRTLASLENYLDVHHQPGEETQRHWGDLGSRLTLQPREDLKLWGTLLHDVGAGRIQRGEVGLRYGREETGSFSLRYVYRNNHLSRSVYSMGSTLADFTGESGYLKRYFQSADTISAQLNIPLNPLTSLEVGAEYDFEKNNLEEHHYYLTRQLHCWTLVGGVGWDDHDFQVMLLLRLTAFPNVKLNLNI